MCTTSGGSWISAVFDEIALEGLDGVTLPWLWTLLERRLQCGSPLPEKLQQQVWTLLLRSTDKVEFFKLKAERPLLPPYDRSKDLDSDAGLPLVPKTCPFLRLPFTPIHDGHIMGNCADFKTRKAIDVKNLKKMTASEATTSWHQKMAIVANQEQRWMALKSPNAFSSIVFTPQLYVFLECIGRSRFNGEQTAGTWSLMNYFKDSSLIFYSKSKLMLQGLITAQSYVERASNKTVCSVLLTLPRFFHVYKSHQQRAMEKLYMEIQMRPSHHILVSEIPDHLEELTTAQVKKVTQSHGFRKFYETTQVRLPVGDSAKDSKKQRKVTVLRLRNPDLKFDELMPSQDSINEAKEEKTSAEFLSQNHAYLDMPVELECLRAIMRFGSRGIGTAELSQYVSVNCHTARGCLKYLRREKVINEFTENVGKTRITRFVAGAQAAADVNLKQEILEKEVQQLQCRDEPTLPPNVDIVMRDLPDITANIRQMTLPKSVNKNLERETQSLVERKKLVVQQIDQKCIIHTYELMTAIYNAEHSVGKQERICRKSLYRILLRMQLAGILNVYELTLQCDKGLRLYRLATHPKIDMEHEQMKREVLRLKNNFHLINEERLSRPGQVNNTKKRKELLAAKRQQLKGQPKPNPPKLLVACILHEFFFYLVGEQPRDSKPLPMSPELLEHWKTAEPSLMTRQFLSEWQADESHILPYTDEINWRTFVPPLPIYNNKPPGWFYFMDAVERMPLSLIMRICRIERESMEQLRPHLQHPVRQHYLLRQLQTQNLIPRPRQQQLFLSTLRLLNNMGLIQVSQSQMGRDGLQRWVYFNRRSCLLDTTPSTGHNYNCISEGRTYEELPYEFNTREQVADYWAKLQHICIYTKLGFKKNRERKVGTKQQLRLPLLVFVRTVDFDEAVELDNASVPGDHKGAAGLSSLLFAHQFRNWSWVKHKSGTVRKAPALKTTGKASAALPVTKRLSLVRLKPVPKLHVRKARGTASVTEQRKRKSGPRDDVDRDALRNMRTLRVTWSAAEDQILKMGRAVYLFIDAPLLALALCNVGSICRDVIRQYLGICNKTTQACVRRLQFLLRQKRDQPDVPNWIYTMQTQPEISSIYNEGFLKELKREYPLRSDQTDALLIHFVIILGKLHRLINSADTIRRQFILPDNMEEYHRQFRECIPLNSDHQDVGQVLYSNPSCETELQVTVAQGVLHSILCCAKDKTLFNLQAFEIYKHFSEEVLNTAFNNARTNSLLVAVKRRNIHTVSRQVSGPAHSLSSKYKCRLIYLKLGHVLYDTYYAFEQRLHEQDAIECRQVTSPNFAQLLLLGEWMAKNRLHLVLQLPANILTVDTSSMSRPCGSASDRILDHYSSIFDNAPQTEYAKRLESECSARQAARVRFHPANLTYRLQCSVYNQLSKLPLRAMHFFCALDSLGQSVNISCARLELGECPFGCIMRSGNYLNAVERITYEHRALLKQLVADALPQTQLQLQLDNSTAGSTTLTVSTSNLLALIQQLEAYWRQQQHQQECKDLGKALADRTLNKLTDWRTLCTGLLDFEAGKPDEEHTQDYEPSLNKEERARAQDVFVVHLPTIQLKTKAEPSKEQLQDKHAQLRKAVLDKVINTSYWRYTENTFDTLLPTLKAKDYDASAIQHMEEILVYIEQRPLGVMGTELRRIFPFGKFLMDALHEMEAHYLIKRVGVASHMYVHKQHMRNWVVHTFHIKRLERERVQGLVAASPATPQAVLGRKRKAAVDESEQPSTSKQAKLALDELKNSEDSDSNESMANRRSKRVEINANKPKAPVASPTVGTVTEDVIVMRPQPWIRVNGSLNRRVLDRWLGAILSECISRNGCTVHSLFLRFPHLLPVELMLLLELLCDLDCIHLMEMEPPPVNVETTYEDELKEQQVTELYDPIYTYVKCHCNAIGCLTNFIGLKQYSSEFI
ncbi:hypothetical protein ACLKA6_013231 [Drosophila palustris]